MNSVRLKDLLLTPVKNGYSPICVDEPTGKWVLGLGALDGIGINLEEVKPVPIDNEKTDPYNLKAGDFLISRSNTLDKVGRTALYQGELKNCSYPDLMMRFRVDEKKVFPNFLEEYLQSEIARRHFMRCAAGTSGSMVKITKSVVEKLIINLPSLADQKAIAEIAASSTAMIEKTESLIDAKERQFGWLESKLLLSNPNAKHWETKTLGQYIEERKEKSAVPDLYPCLTSSRRGMFLQNEFFSKQVASKDNAGYKIMSRGDFTYRSMSDDSTFVFNQQNIVDKGLISPAYGVFAPNKNMDADFLHYFLNSSVFKRALTREVQGGTRTALRLNALKKLDVDMPELPEQQSIANKLNTAKREIDLLIKLADQYRTQKRGLMQKLLSGEWHIKKRR